MKPKKSLFLLAMIFLTNTMSFASSLNGLSDIIETISNEDVYNTAQETLTSFEEHQSEYETITFGKYRKIEQQLSTVISLIQEIDADGTKTSPRKLDTACKEIQRLVSALQNAYFSNMNMDTSQDVKTIEDLCYDMQQLQKYVLNPEYVTVGSRLEQFVYSLLCKHKVRTGIAALSAAAAMVAGTTYWKSKRHEKNNHEAVMATIPVFYAEKYNIVAKNLIEELLPVLKQHASGLKHSFDGEKYRKVYSF